MIYETNHPLSKENYLHGLNKCFPGWGDETTFNWFYRNASFPRADMITASRGGNYVAGSSVVYRTLQVNSTPHLVGIMSGSWTLPEARKQGCFTEMIRISKSLCEDKKAIALLAYVTEANPSRRRIESEGSCLIPSVYAVSEGIFGTPSVGVSFQNEFSDQFVSTLHKTAPDHSISFTYQTEKEFYKQFIDRPLPVLGFQLPCGACGIIEKAGDTDRVLCLKTSHFKQRLNAMNQLRFLSARNQRNFFFYATANDDLRIAKELGMTLLPGFITVSPSKTAGKDLLTAIKRTPWNVQSGDRV